MTLDQLTLYNVKACDDEVTSDWAVSPHVCFTATLMKFSVEFDQFSQLTPQNQLTSVLLRCIHFYPEALLFAVDV